MVLLLHALLVKENVPEKSPGFGTLKVMSTFIAGPGLTTIGAVGLELTSVNELVAAVMLKLLI
jgi:hypothetical protein